MSSRASEQQPVVVVTGANGLVGSRTCATLSERGAAVVAVVRRPGTAPTIPGVQERVGDFTDPDLAAEVCAGADALVTTVHPMGSDLATQRTVGVEGTATIARAAAKAGVRRVVHLSTAAVIARAPDIGDVDETSALVGEDAGDYAVTKREVEETLAAIDGPTRVLVRPPAILGPSESSVWNTLRPAAMREDESQRRATPGATFAWVHVDDLAAMVAHLATGAIATAERAEQGPVEGDCTPVDLAGEPATQRDYVGTATTALGLAPVWVDDPAWRGQILTDRARTWGWTPQVTLRQALDELAAGLRS